MSLDVEWCRVLNVWLGKWKVLVQTTAVVTLLKRLGTWNKVEFKKLISGRSGFFVVFKTCDYKFFAVFGNFAPLLSRKWRLLVSVFMKWLRYKEVNYHAKAPNVTWSLVIIEVLIYVFLWFLDEFWRKKVSLCVWYEVRKPAALTCGCIMLKLQHL